MNHKKHLLLIGLLITLFVFVPSARAATDNIDSTVNDLKTKVEEKLPEATKSWQQQILPFFQKTFTNTETWLKQNMPAAAKEFSIESQTLPLELWNSIKDICTWLMNFFKR